MKRGPESVFWDGLKEDLKDPEFFREFVVESARIATIDAIVNELDEAREAAGLSKAALARAIGAPPESIRRLFSSSEANPTLGTLAEVATALGLRVSVEPISKAERKRVTEPLLVDEGDSKSLERYLTAIG